MKKSTFVMLGLALLALGACSNDDSKGNSNVPVRFYLTDAPAILDFKEVNLDVQSVRYSLEGENWITLPVQPVIVDLLQYINGQDTLLSNITLKAGVKIQQIRLVLGSNNSLVLNDGTPVSLDVPSGQSSGFKINVQSVPEITGGYRVVIDFDAARSIVAKGNGTYSLKPVIRAYIAANTSSVYGYLTPANEMRRVFTLDGEGDTISTVSDTLQNNYFKLHGLFSGMYKIEVQNLTSGDFSVLKESVTVVGGTDVNLGTLPIPVP